MKSYSNEDLIQRLTTEFGYPARGAALVADKLTTLQPTLQMQFASWWYDGGLPRATIEDYSVERLMREHSMNPIAAILTLDWLLREPEKAKASLRRGHDDAVRAK